MRQKTWKRKEKCLSLHRQSPPYIGMIFYFSGTGNTRWVASEIAKAIKEELFYIPDLIREERLEFSLHDGERIGFCFPTHGWQVPRIVREFIKRLKMNTKDHYCWALTTCGDNMGETMTILNRDLAANELLANNGVPLQADTTFSVIMPESYVCLPFMKTDPEEKEQWKIENARRQLQHIIPIIKDCKRGIEELDKGATRNSTKEPLPDSIRTSSANTSTNGW